MYNVLIIIVERLLQFLNRISTNNKAIFLTVYKYVAQKGKFSNLKFEDT